MPQNKRESIIFTVMMCFVMVLIMSIYNVALHMGEFSINTIKQAWIGFPIAYIFALCCDMLFVSRNAKNFAFKYIVNFESKPLHKILAISGLMVVQMVIIMSFYGALEACVSTGSWNNIIMIWLTNIPKNFIMALPLQLIIAGPLVRTSFRKLFPVGSILG